MKLSETSPDLPLMPKEDVNRIKKKLGKKYRNESDWTTIENILKSYSLITAAPLHSTLRVRNVSGVLCEADVLMAFTNMDDCEKHLKNLCKMDSRIGPTFQRGTISFMDLTWLADKTQKDVFIDMQAKPNTVFMSFSPRTAELRAMVLYRRG
ncbi:MAG: hypothetical protein IJ088_05620 [Clostridia bacterium]|nr:hypothetical protein [Clostridia bacterium]